MKLKQLQEARIHGRETWGVNIDLSNEEYTVGPFSSEEEAKSFFERIVDIGHERSKDDDEFGESWYDDKEFDYYQKPVKIMPPQELLKRLDI